MKFCGLLAVATLRGRHTVKVTTRRNPVEGSHERHYDSTMGVGTSPLNICRTYLKRSFQHLVFQIIQPLETHRPVFEIACDD